MRGVFWLVAATLLYVGCDTDSKADDRAVESVVVVDEPVSHRANNSHDDPVLIDPVSDALARAVDALLAE